MPSSAPSNANPPAPPAPPDFRGHPLGCPTTFSAGEAHVGWWTLRQKIGRLLWWVVQATVFRWSFRRADDWRATLLRWFGATIGEGCLIRGSIRVEVPWNLTLGARCSIGEGAILYCLGPVTVGDRTMISQYAHICAGTHDHTRSDYPLYRVPIRIGSDVWLCADTYVAPGVVVGDGVMVGARGVVVKDLPPWTTCVGMPARPIGPRAYRNLDTGETVPATDAQAVREAGSPAPPTSPAEPASSVEPGHR